MLLTQNSKMRKASLKTYDFCLPALETCIGADKCKSYCYATKGFYKIPTVKAKHKANLEATKCDWFTNAITCEIKQIKDLDAVRIHSAGDFYSREYLHKWLKICDDNPEIDFYAYTKSIPLFIGERLPDNLKLIFSEGGKYNHLIKKHNLRPCSVSEEYGDNDTSDIDDSMILFSDKPITLIKRNLR